MWCLKKYSQGIIGQVNLIWLYLPVYNDFYTQHRRGLCESRSDGHFQFTTAKRISSFDVPLGSTKASRQTDADALYDRRSYRLSRAVSE